ncbi:hypothetical protein CPC08DRAFT_702326 [Agrocybe pediades]|nr:hypothetical protein CPC08DRAFT_702326 [Agrocybe pediades]
MSESRRILKRRVVVKGKGLKDGRVKLGSWGRNNCNRYNRQSRCHSVDPESDLRSSARR